MTLTQHIIVGWGWGGGVFFDEKICTVHNSHNENKENGKYF